MDPQLAIRQNIEEYHDYVKSLNDWQQEIKAKEAQVAGREQVAQSKKGAPRQTTKADEEEEARRLLKEAQAKLEQTQKGRIASGDYRSWDQFDIDAAMEQVDLEEKVKEQETRLRKQQALKAKEAGNLSFRQKKYQEAVEQYSESISLDPSEAVYYLNRAMALLKLERFADAEQDCTESLKLSHSNVKALWRRGVARMHLRRFADAAQDFKYANAIDPNNEEIKALLKESSEAAEKEQQKRHRRRLVPIEEIGELSPDSTPTAPSITVVDSVHEESLVKETKPELALMEEKPSRPVVTVTESVVEANTVVTNEEIKIKPKPTPSLKVPKMAHEFERDFKLIAHDPELLYGYLKAMDPSHFKPLFHSCLTPTHITAFLSVVNDFFLKNEPTETIVQFLRGLSETGRFTMNLKFIGKSSRNLLESIFASIGTDYEELRQRYGLSQ